MVSVALVVCRRGQHQVAGLAGREPGLDRLCVSHLADEDYVRVLAQHPPHGLGPVSGVRADLSLADDRHLVPVEHLDGVLDGDDVGGPVGVYVVDHGGQGRRLPRTRRAGNEHQPPVLLCQPCDDRRQAELGGCQRTGQHPPHDQPGRTPLPEGVATEPPEAVGGKGEIGFSRLLVLCEPVRRHDHLDEVLALLMLDGRERRHTQVAIDPRPGRGAHLDVQVGRALLNDVAEDGG